jgi:hypothetical protein
MRRSFVALCSALLMSTVVLMAVVPSVGSQPPAPALLDIGLFGDMPYGDEGIAMFPALMADINGADLAFVVHVGDIKSGSTLCTDEWFAFIFDSFQAMRNPLVYTPGDNEWTDCHRENNGSYNSLERLARLRQVFFPNSNSLGSRQIALERQSADPQFADYPENVRWTYSDVTFAALHVVGSNNNLGRDEENDAEYAARNAANLVWLHQAFEQATSRGDRAVMILMQANPWEGPADARTGFVDFLAALEAETVAFGRPVVLVHGDSHYFRIDKPRISTRRPDNFTRVEVFGEVDNHWVRATIDPADPNVFTFREALVQANMR